MGAKTKGTSATSGKSCLAFRDSGYITTTLLFNLFRPLQQCSVCDNVVIICLDFDIQMIQIPPLDVAVFQHNEKIKTRDIK